MSRRPFPRFERTARTPLSTALAALTAALLGALPMAARADNLVDLYTAAHAFDAAYLSARALADSAVYRAAQADALRLPNVGLSASATRNEIAADVFGIAGGSDRAGATTTGATVSARQPLYNRANTATIAQAERLLQSSTADLETAEQDLIVRVAQAYFDVLGAQDNLGTAQTSKRAIAEQLASAQRNFEVGTATITDTREAQARFDLATSQEIAADNDLRSKRIVLDQLVGRANVQPNPLAVPVLLPPLRPADPEQWVTSAFGAHPSIRRAQLGLDIALLETEKARAGNLPTVDLVGSLTQQHANGAAAQIPGNSTSAALGVQLNLPLFAGYSIQNRIRETTVLEDKSRNDLEATRRGVAIGTRQAYYGVQSGEAQVRALEAAEASSKLALEATQLGYRVGVRVNIDVLNAQTQLFQTQRDLAFARYNVLLGGLRLRQAAGVLKADDLAAVNTLVAR